MIGELKLTTWDANCCVELGEVWVISTEGSVISDWSLELSTWSLTEATLLPPEDVTDVADVGADLADGVVTTAGDGGGGIILEVGGRPGASLLGCTTGFASVVTDVGVVVDCCCCGRCCSG